MPERTYKNPDERYVTRNEWNMHLRASESRDSTVNKHLSQQDDKIDKLEAQIMRIVGGASAAIILIQIATTIFLSQH